MKDARAHLSLKRLAYAFLIFCFLAIGPLNAQAQSQVQTRQQPALPHVAVLATGGTIAGTAATETQTTGYKPGELTADALLKSVPSLGKVAQVSGEQVSNVGSDNITNVILLKLSKRVNELLAQPDIAGVVITHGTDTLEETAYFLNLVVKSDKPVVVTGSMRPSTAISADGPSNLLQAVTVAASPAARARGVMIVLNDRIGSARYTTKTHADSLDTFKSPDDGYLGTLVDNVPHFETAVAKLHTSQTPFDVSKLDSLPEVDIIYGYQNDGGYLYDAAVAHGARGIVVAGVGAGSESLLALPSIKKAIDKRVIVVRSSRTGGGYVPEDPAYVGLLGDNLNPQKARILLMLGLTLTNDPARIQEMLHQF
ncbi:L-asparaginase, type II [Caballeronia arvi]|uniref:L-asparaginase, type II n=1 Tax=Caballeronia arvi TaxID=1777135 RepID=A0A158KID5_9BURK|nr:type II asparaginase [Caballeronia arvi]SAL80908.1 L-asparaginase, type II [Caballeronia arvi]